MLSDNEFYTFNEFYGKYKIDFRYFKLSKEKSYISHLLKEPDINSWNHYSPIFISAQTGMGKNHFIQHYLIRHLNSENIANNKHKKILLLSNRVALTKQTKQQLAQNLRDIVGDTYTLKNMEYYTDEGIDKLYCNFGIIHVCSYHQLYYRLIHKEGRKKLKKQQFNYVIFDECHFFTSDSTFNRNTQYILKHSIETFQNAIRIYMSATLEESFIPIISTESKICSKLSEENSKIECKYYYFERNYSYIEKINVYDKLENLPAYIKDTSEDKWLIFVASKKDGKALREELTYNEIESAFLTKDSKSKNSSNDSSNNENEYQTYRNIVENEKFNQRVLISTSALDNGINIKDSLVKHIVIDMLDRTEFIQMLGRIRISNDQKINLYIRDYSSKDIEDFLANDIKALLVRLRTDSVDEEDRANYYQDFQHFKYQKEQIFRLTKGKKQFKYNKCSIYKLMDRISCFLNIIRATNSDYAIDLQSLGEFRADRSKIYQHYLQENSYKNDVLLCDQLCQILESVDEKGFREEGYNSRIFSEATKYSFIAYVYKVLIPNFLAKMALENIEISPSFNEFGEEYEYDRYFNGISSDELNPYQKLSNFRNQVMFHNDITNFDDIVLEIDQTLEEIDYVFNYYSSMLNLDDSEVPALTEQIHWLERDLIYTSDFNYLNENKVKLPTEEEIAELIEKHSIDCDYFEKVSKENKQNVSFKDLDTLKEKGCPIKELNPDYQMIFAFFASSTATELEQKLERDPFVFADVSYKLKLIRSTKTEDQRKYCIFVKYGNCEVI